MNGVIFDFDGVLADSETLSWNAWREVLRPFGVDVSDDDVLACTGTNSRDTYAHFAQRRDLPPYVEVLAAVDQHRRSRYPAELRAFPDAVNAVQSLAIVGVPLAIATSSSRHNLDLKLDVLELGRYFDATVAGDEVPSGKPEPDLYQEAVRRLGIIPDTSVAVEDTRIGADAAAAAGLRTVIVNRMGFDTGMHPTISEVDPDLLLLWLGRV